MKQPFMIGAAALAMVLTGLITVSAQTTTSTTSAPAGAAATSTATITGDVVYIEGNVLVARLPGGELRMFSLPPTQQFMIDGQPKRLADLKQGTSLTAQVTTTTQPVTVRTVSVTNGTVWYVSGNTVILTLENGENRQYTVTPTFQFTVEGRPATVADLRKGMKVSGSRIVESPVHQMSTTAVITGKAPK